jgi:hypothetical protein
MPANLTGQQIVLPEGTNASRFKQSQYNNAVKMVGLTFDERGGKPLSVDTILEEIKEATNLETDRDARAVLDTAIKSGDLTESKQTVYRTYKPENDQLVSTYPTRAAADAAAKKQGLNVREATLTQVAPKAAPVIPSKPRAGLPAGYDITERHKLLPKLAVNRSPLFWIKWRCRARLISYPQTAKRLPLKSFKR